MLDAACSTGHVTKSHRLQNIRAGDSQDQCSPIPSFYRVGKLDYLGIGKTYSFIDSLMKEDKRHCSFRRYDV